VGPVGDSRCLPNGSVGSTHLRQVGAAATLLQNLGVPARDAQLILGNSRLAVTLEIYSHENRQAQREVLGHGSAARVK